MQVVPKDSNSIENDPAEDDPKPLYLLGPRHIDYINKYTEELPPWRLKDRMKTVSVALVLCLNLHVDPPDIIKTNPCARLECWFDPHKCNLATKPIKQIGNKLQKQYETWQRRARYKQSLDPTIDDVQTLCTSLRRNAKEERVLFHYNGHGVPRPTDNGEIWVFNTTYTQYIPLLVYNLQTWLGSPSIYVYDCSNAGVLLKHFTPQGVCRQASDGSDGGDSSGENYPDNTTTTIGPSDHHGAAAAGGGPVAQQPPAAAATQPSQQQLQTKLKMPQNLSELQQQVFRDKQMRLMSTQQREGPQPLQPAADNTPQDNYNNEGRGRLDGKGPAGNNHNDLARQQSNYNQFQPNLPTLHPVNPNLVKGIPNFQVNPLPGQDNINIHTSLGPNLAPNGGSERSSPQPFMVGECIHLCACDAGELLPMCPELPADVFTACLTTPITMAVRWFLLQRHSSANAPPPLHIADEIPGELNDRRTVLGELNWIFTAITDTIAWNALPLELFQKLFRQDLLVASLFRNFLLAERIMRSYGCTPVSLPKLPATHSHPMWQSWDLSLQHCLSQLWPNLALTLSSGSGSVPDSVANKLGNAPARSAASAAAATAKSGQVTGNGAAGGKALVKNGNKEAQYLALPANIQNLQLPFFQCQLLAFQVWLELPHHNREPPEQLPVLLQVLLSQVYRPHALELLCSFLALGRWAVHLVLSVGIFPYILKLLQSTSRDLRPKLVTLWAKILAVEQTCKADLVREGGFQYFLEVLADTTMQPEHRGMAAFILSVMAKDEPEVQKKLLIPICLEQITNSTLPLPYDGDNTTYDYTTYDRHDMYADACVRMWPAVCLAATWHCAPDVRWSATRDNAHEKLFALLKDPVPEVRAASIYALGSFLASLPLSEQSDEQARTINNSIAVTLCNCTAQYDASPIVRMELAVALQFVVLLYESSFTQLVAGQIVEQDDRYRNPHMNQSFSGVCRTPNRAFPGAGSSYSDASDTLTAILSPTAHLSLSRRTGSGASGHGNGGAMHRAASVHAINSSGGGGLWCGSVLSSSGLYAKLWLAMQGLARDPHQAVANIARTVTNNITEKAEAILASKRRGSGCDASGDDSSLDLRTFSVSGGSSHYRTDSPPLSGRSTPRSKPLATAYPSGEQFITPLVQSPLPVWGARLLVTPVYCPLDTPPAVQHFKNMTDLILTRTALQTPCDKPVNLRLLTRSAEQQLMQDLRKPSTDGVGGTPRSRPRPHPKLDLEVLNEKLSALPSVLLFHPVTPHLVVCDKTHVSTYNLERSELVNRWPNHPMPSQRITSACVINYTSETPLLAVAADDGSVRVWSDPFNRTRTRVRGYGRKDPYFKTNWLEAKSGTSTSKTSKPNRDFTNNDSMVYGWKRKGSNLFVGSTYIGDNLGGFLGDGCRSILRSENVLMGGFFSKGYGWHNPGGSGKGSPAVANTPSPSGGGGWGAAAWGGGSATVITPPPPVNGWAAGSNTFLEVRPSESSLVTPVMVTAFTATTNVRPGMKGPGPLLSWCQQSGRLAVAGGEYRTIRLWDMRTELHSGDLLHSNATAANYAACITAMHSRGPLITAGFSDGCVMLLDSRVGVSLPGVVGALGWSTSGGRSARERCVLQDWKDGEAWVLCSQLKDDYTILAGSVSGAVHLLDARNRGSITLLQASSEITAMDANLSHQLFAFGTVSQSLTVHRVDGQAAPAVNTIQCSDGFLGGQRASPIAAVAFHPDRPLLAAAANNSTVAVYGLQRR